jgi:glycosyltransferase involved in cell wall biosynthesis
VADVPPNSETEVWSAEPADRGPTVVYIAGSGRSGSTILERVLGEMPGFVNVGELIDLSRRSCDNERCGCGLPFTSCPFWLAVGKRAFGGWDNGSLAELGRLRARVARQRHLPRLLALPAAGSGFRADVSAYGSCHKKLYSAIATEAGAEYVVDSTKWPVQALALARAGLDLRVIHLVRDARGVAYSLGKGGSRPHALDDAELMWHNPPASAAARWTAFQAQAELLRGCGLRVARMNYEDFVCEPRQSVERALAALGLPHGPAKLAHIDGTRVMLGKSHGLSGNPSRFRDDGQTALHPDEAWHHQMPRSDRVIVTSIALPFLLRYRRRLRNGRPPAAPPAGSAAPVAAGRATWPDVSVIVTTRGRPEMVRETVASVVAQTYRGNIECIVVHDQEPPDESLALLGTARCRVRVMENTRAPGLSGARNTGLGAASADYLATCDDDDLWHPGKLELQIARLLDEQDLIAVGSGLRLILPGGEIRDWPARAERVGYQLLLRNRVKELHSSTLVMRRSAITQAGCYDEEIPFGYAEDYDWLLRLAKVGGLGLVQRPLADIRRNGTSRYQGNGERVSVGLEYLLAKHPDFTTTRRGHARLLGQIAFARSTLGERRRALRLTMQSLALWPASPYPYVALVHIMTGTQFRHLMRAARLFHRELA